MTLVRLEPGPRVVLRYFHTYHTYVGSGHFFGFKILNFNIFFFRILFIRGAGCMKILWIFFVG